MIWIILGAIPLIAALVRLAWVDDWLHVLLGIFVFIACVASIAYGIVQIT